MKIKRSTRKKAEALIKSVSERFPMYLAENVWVDFEDPPNDAEISKREAIALSTYKWRTIARSHSEQDITEELDLGTSSCGLCIKYYVDGYVPEDCKGCPIYEATGEALCNGFQEYTNYHRVRYGSPSKMFAEAAEVVAERIFQMLCENIEEGEI